MVELGTAGGLSVGGALNTTRLTLEAVFRSLAAEDFALRLEKRI